MKNSIIPIFGIILLQGVCIAQEEPPLLSPEERQTVEAQTNEFNQSLAPALTDSAKSTVRVWSNKRRLAYGTVIGDGHKILTKWSEVRRSTGNLRIESAAGDVSAATITGVYDDEDLVVLETNGTALTPVKWSVGTPGLGCFLAAPQPNGKPAGFGIVSVLERNLRDRDQAYLGVIGAPNHVGPGVKIQEVAADSGAAAAGLRPGNVILKVGERPVSGVLELRNSLVDVKPGAKVMLAVRVGNVEKPFEVLLGNRPAFPKFPGDRLNLMEQMGGPISGVRDTFGRVIQTDMRLQPDQIGGPVVDLKGRVIGISMARAGRTNSYVMPSTAVESLLKKEPQNPALVQNRRTESLPDFPGGRATPQGRTAPRNRQRMQQHAEEMQRLMNFMRDEMEGLEPQR